MPIRIVRLGSPRRPGECLRLGTVRRPPRGVPKAEYAARDFYDTWLPELSPSPELVASAKAASDPKAWAAFRKRFRAEMNEPGPSRLLDLLAALGRQTSFSLGCYCEDEAHCHRSVLRELLVERGAEILPESFVIREARPEEFEALGQLMVRVYAALEGFPSPQEQPGYYQMLAAIGRMTEKPHTKLLVAASEQGLLGGVVYFSDMAQYGSGGTATQEKNASGFRLLAVAPEARGLGVGKALVERCLQLAREHHHPQVIIHTTEAMQVAWRMYETLGFRRSTDLDFLQGKLQVYGFRLKLQVA